MGAIRRRRRRSRPSSSERRHRRLASGSHPACLRLPGSIGLHCHGDRKLGACLSRSLFPRAAPGVCTISGATISFVGGGTCTINANLGPQRQLPACTAGATVVHRGRRSLRRELTDDHHHAPARPPCLALVARTPSRGPPARALQSCSRPMRRAPASPARCRVLTGLVHRSGSWRVNADQPGNSNYLPVPQQHQSFPIGLAQQNITFTSTPPEPHGARRRDLCHHRDGDLRSRGRLQRRPGPTRASARFPVRSPRRRSASANVRSRRISLGTAAISRVQVQQTLPHIRQGSRHDHDHLDASGGERPQVRCAVHYRGDGNAPGSPSSSPLIRAALVSAFVLRFDRVVFRQRQLHGLREPAGKTAPGCRAHPRRSRRSRSNWVSR